MTKELSRSEIEVKFEAPGLSREDFMNFMTTNFYGGIREYKKVAGWDDYYVQGENVVRHRCDGRKKRSTLTVKRRKSEDSISDRHEVDLPVGDKVPASDVSAFLKMSGWKLLFTIEKESFIYLYELPSGTKVCVALYDVWRPGQHRDKLSRRFLEIEIEKDSKIDIETARQILDDWTTVFKKKLKLAKPLNSSLYEMYAPTPLDKR